MNVRMRHPGLPKADPAITSQEAFDEVWAKKGWQVVTDEPVTEPADVKSATPSKPGKEG